MNNRRGSILAVTLGFVLVFTMLGLSSIYMGTIQNEAAEKRIASMKAFWLAEAGLEKAQWEVKKNNCQGLKQAGSYCSSCSACSNGDKVLEETVAGYGSYSVLINKINTISTTTSVGSFRESGHPLFTQRTVRFAEPRFSYALFADNKIVLKSSITIDSYDSLGGSSLHDGDIGTNGAGTQLDPAIKIDVGLVHIFGDVSTGGNGTGYVDYGGPIHSINVTAGSNPHISCKEVGGVSPCESIDTHTNSVSLPPVVVPDALKNMTPTGTKITDDTTLSAGDYRYESVDLSLNKTLTIDGNVNLYLTGAESLDASLNCKIILNPGASFALYADGHLKFANNIEINNSGRPSDFQVFSTYTGNDPSNPGILMENNGDLRGTIYAPQTNIEIGSNGDLLGAVVGEDITVKLVGDIFYDETLGGGTKSSGAWQEI